MREGRRGRRPEDPAAHLDDAGSVFKVGEGPHDVLTHRLHRLLPGAGEPADQLGDPNCRETESGSVSVVLVLHRVILVSQLVFVLHSLKGN